MVTTSEHKILNVFNSIYLIFCGQKSPTAASFLLGYDENRSNTYKETDLHTIDVMIYCYIISSLRYYLLPSFMCDVVSSYI